MDEMEQAALAASTASLMSGFVTSLEVSYRKLVTGDEFAPGERLPSRITSEALDVRGGIVCRLLYAYADRNPTTADLPFLDRLSTMIERLFAVGDDVAQRLELAVRSGIRFVRRFSINPRRMFTQAYFERLSERLAKVPDRRMRFVEMLCGSVRRFLAWLRSSLRRLEARHLVDPMRPISLSPHAKELVEMADRRLGIVILKAGPREGSRPFHVLPNSSRAWEILRRLCEGGDADGYVDLPANYASAFHRTNRNNDTVYGDCERLLRHIVPGLRSGTYRLELEEKPPLRRGL